MEKEIKQDFTIFQPVVYTITAVVVAFILVAGATSIFRLHNTFMKTAFTIILSGLFLCGCSPKQAASSSRPAIDLVEPGKDIVWRDGYVLHVMKRDGASLEGIQISVNSPSGQTTMSADTGTVSPVVEGNVTNDSSVVITLHDAKVQVGSDSSSLPQGDFPIKLYK
jgi:hypothetical protein